MASLTTTASSLRSSRLVANPWLWMFVALLTAGTALLWTRFVHHPDDPLSAWQIILVVVSMVTAGSAVAIRLSSSKESFLESLPVSRRHMLILLALLHASLILDVIFLLLARTASADVPWHLGSLIFMLVLILPVAGWVALSCYRCILGPPARDKQTEGAALLVLFAVVACLSGWALYIDQANVYHWDTMRVFLATIALYALLGAPLLLMPLVLRKIIISIAIVLHFLGILCAILSVAPTPWLVAQLRQRIYRPYLQFMFLENAYQFYAPDPGPSNYWKFRLEYKDPDGKTLHSRWVEFPEMNDKTGTPNYLTGLQYYRRVAMSDQLAVTDGVSPPLLITNSKGKIMDNPLIYWRYRCAKIKPQRLLGEPMAEVPIPPEWEVPFHPNINPPLSQYRHLTDYSRKLLKSVVQHMAKLPHDKHPEAKIHRIKVYHVIHQWPTPELINNDVLATHPMLYYPYYQGEYDPEGNLVDEPQFDDNGNLISGNPLLHWMIPYILEEGNHPNMCVVRSYMRRHAGEEKWKKYPGKNYWQAE